MIERASREPYRVRGENVPVWLPMGLVTLGLLGAIVTAQLLLASWSNAFDKQSRRIEIGISAAQVPPPMAGPEPGEIRQASGLADEPEATPSQEDVSLPAAADADLVAEQISSMISRGGADPEQSSDETAIDCAPLFSVVFNRGSDVPQARDMNKKVTRLARWLSTHPTAIVYVEGYADASGPEEANLVLSFRRANALAALLRESGASKAQLIARAYGEDPSLAPSSESEPQRRASLKIDAGMPCIQQESNEGGPR